MGLFATYLLAAGCETTPLPEEVDPNKAVLGPGEICFEPEPQQLRLRVQPSVVVMAVGQSRKARIVVDPDLCIPRALSLSSSNETVVATPSQATVSYGKPTVDLMLEGLSIGESEIEVTLPTGEGDQQLRATLKVEVTADQLLSCTATDNPPSKLLEAGSAIEGSGGLAGAKLTLPEDADAENSGSFIWSVPAFEASLGCGDSIVPSGYVALGPAVHFGPSDKVMPREIPLQIPFNPARVPTAARGRHIELAYSSPRFKSPRTVPVTNLRSVQQDGTWALGFESSRLGTYQAVVRTDAGTIKRSRTLSHRAVIGVSMGGAGAAQFGLRHHHLFDVAAALGGPVDWTWLANHLEHNHLGGFRPIAPGTKAEDIPLVSTPCKIQDDCKSDEQCLGARPEKQGRCVILPATQSPYEHASNFNHWWYEYPRTGNGGSFKRLDYIQIFRDLALMFGNPNGYNPEQLNLPAGVDPTHPSQTGMLSEGDCSIWVDPISGHPNEEQQKTLNSLCPKERCKYTQVLKNYYDDEYNPDGTFDVITFCDGSPQKEELSPYANTWTESSNNYPFEVGLAVDYNGNGKRDELEPVIRAGHEPWQDLGSDGLASEDEPGYGPDNLDPAGDDYEPQFNPAGTEGDHRYQPGEPFDDYGLDGVPNTKTSPYDHGEGDGIFSVAPGLQRMWDYDSHSIVRGWSKSPPVPLDDKALSRFDFWTDGGTRDLFNCVVAAQHVAGTFVARGRKAGYFANFTSMPGSDPNVPELFNPAHLVYEDMPGVVHMRYGFDRPNAQQIETGSGQHVGTATEITRRLQSALYFIASRWPDASRSLVETSADKPAEGAPNCEVNGNCTFEFTSSFGRTGPVGVSLPPGYAHADQKDLRYPVIYMLHGYGMTPEDLQAAIVFLRNWMNGPTDSQHSRLAKSILVYVDGRCRNQKDGQGGEKAECIRGSFFTDSIRPDGAKMDAWWLELMDEVDRRYRTMGPSTIESID
jgi:hypothetical protein